MRTSSSNFASNCRMLDRNCCRISLIPWLHVVLLCIPATQLIDIFQPGEGVVPRAPEQCSCLAVDVRTPPPAQCCLHIHSRGPWKSSCQGLSCLFGDGSRFTIAQWFTKRHRVSILDTSPTGSGQRTLVELFSLEAEWTKTIEGSPVCK